MVKKVLLSVIFVFGFGVAGVAHADMLGQNITFSVDPKYDATAASSVTATLRAIGQHVYFYIDDRYWTGLSPAQQVHFTDMLSQIANTFDTATYLRSTSFWGPENTPGIDNDPHIVVLFEKLGNNAGGYFRTVDSYPHNLAPQGNSREMFYISTDSVFNGGASEFMAHEFQHLISFYQKELLEKVHDDTWINEARSEFNITQVGLNEPFQESTLEYRKFSFLRSPSDSLVEWPNTAADYGIATIFMHYLADRFGTPVVQGTLTLPYAGVSAINNWFAQQNRLERFSGIFTDWMVASYLNDPAFGDAYTYVRPGLRDVRVTPQQSVPLNSDSQYTTAIPLKEWQPYWLRFDLAPNITAAAFNVRITGQQGPWWGGALTASYTDGSRSVTTFSAIDPQHPISLPMVRGVGHLMSATLALTQGTDQPADNRSLSPLVADVSASFGDPIIASPAPQGLKDGDLIRHGTEPEIYVIWGSYRRYLRNDVLKLYGFENRPVTSVSSEVFNRYTTSNYIRSINGEKVYAVWPDGTKHWLNITPQQWDASGRDWNAIFIVNDLEVNFYATGPDITR